MDGSTDDGQRVENSFVSRRWTRSGEMTFMPPSRSR